MCIVCDILVYIGNNFRSILQTILWWVAIYFAVKARDSSQEQLKEMKWQYITKARFDIYKERIKTFEPFIEEYESRKNKRDLTEEEDIYYTIFQGLIEEAREYVAWYYREHIKDVPTKVSLEALEKLD